MATNRPAYRDSREPRAVRVYTIAQESRYLIIENVPSLGLIQELLNVCSSFGPVEEHCVLDDHAASTEFTDVVWVKFASATAARIAKRKMDDQPFFANLLRVYYAPESETVSDVRNKLLERQAAVCRRLNRPVRSSIEKKQQQQAEQPQPQPQQQQQQPVYGPHFEPASSSKDIQRPPEKKRRRI